MVMDAASYTQIELMWRLMPLAEVAARLGIDYDHCIQAYRQGHIRPLVPWIADQGIERRKTSSVSVLHVHWQ